MKNEIVMDTARAKEFILIPLLDDSKIYISKSLDTLIEKNGENDIIGIYGVVDTSDGEVLMTTDYAYSGEVILMRRFLHKKFFINKYTTKDVIEL